VTVTEAEVRSNLGTLMDATVADEVAHHLWDYHAVRPMYVPAAWAPGDDEEGDCSKGVQYVCRWEGSVHDPMGMDWGPYGNSTTICLHLTHLDSLADVRVGDIVTFGLHGDEHAAMVRGLVKRNGKVVDLNLWSFGHQGAPNFYLLSQDGREYQLLRVRLAIHAHAKTPPSVLRAKTGYWSWRQWRLGTGAWHGYGKRDRDVRPNVPHRIPAAWWKRFAQSLPKQRKRRPNRVTAGTLAASAG
jgi:hypothetical protein